MKNMKYFVLNTTVSLLNNLPADVIPIISDPASDDEIEKFNTKYQEKYPSKPFYVAEPSKVDNSIYAIEINEEEQLNNLPPNTHVFLNTKLCKNLFKVWRAHPKLNYHFYINAAESLTDFFITPPLDNQLLLPPNSYFHISADRPEIEYEIYKLYKNKNLDKNIDIRAALPYLQSDVPIPIYSIKPYHIAAAGKTDENFAQYVANSPKLIATYDTFNEVINEDMTKNAIKSYFHLAVGVKQEQLPLLKDWLYTLNKDEAAPINLDIPILSEEETSLIINKMKPYYLYFCQTKEEIIINLATYLFLVCGAHEELDLILSDPFNLPIGKILDTWKAAPLKLKEVTIKKASLPSSKVELLQDLSITLEI